VIRTGGLTKRYGPRTALDALDLTIEEGEWCLYLGPNGAGKSTTLKLLVGLARPDAGRARVAGLDPWRDGPRVRRVVGYLPEDYQPHAYLTGREVLELVGDVFGMPRRARDARIEGLLDLLDLGAAADLPTRGYSHGMRKKLGLAVALIDAPGVLVLDEPTAELDPRTSDLIRRVLRGLADRGTTILMSTHLLGDAALLADTVAMLDRGRLVERGPIRDVLARHDETSLERVFLSLTGAADERKIASFLGPDAP